jgi:hypothetical protein
MSMDSEDGFERGFARGWAAAMRRVAEARQENDIRAAEAEHLFSRHFAEQEEQIRKMQGVRAGSGG